MRGPLLLCSNDLRLFLLSDLNQVDTLGSIDIIYINIKVFVAERYHDNLANSTVFFISNISNFI